MEQRLGCETKSTGVSVGSPSPLCWEYDKQRQNGELLREKASVSIDGNWLESELKHYEWRQQTKFPVVKVISFTMVGRTAQNYLIEVQSEVFPFRLGDLKDLPLFRLLYLLKQSLIGYERLYYRFGPFVVTPMMIGINSQHRCNVWVNENFASNQLRRAHSDEASFLQKIFEMFERFCQKSKIVTGYFQQLRKYRKFYSAISFNESYAKEHKIKISSSFQPREASTHDRNSPRAVHNLLHNSSEKHNFKASLSNKFAAVEAMNFKLFIRSSQVGDGLEVEDMSKHRVGERQNCEQERLRSELKMKRSGQTAADINSSITLSPSIQSKSSISLQGFEGEEIAPNPFKCMLKSDQTLGKGQILQRNFSNSEIQYRPNGQIQYRSNGQIEYRSSQFKSIDMSCRIKKALQEDAEQDSLSIGDLFAKNKWDKTIGGLFEAKDMKKSYHDGKEYPSNLQEHKKLQLLDRMGEMAESFIHSDYGDKD